jgi:hypothetical protein
LVWFFTSRKWTWFFGSKDLGFGFSLSWNWIGFSQRKWIRFLFKDLGFWFFSPDSYRDGLGFSDIGWLFLGYWFVVLSGVNI